MLQQGTKLALETPDDWRELINSTAGGRQETISLLVTLLDYVSNQSAILCLTLAALSLESPKVDKNFSIARSVLVFNSRGADGQSLFNFIQGIFDAEKAKKSEEVKDGEDMQVDDKATMNISR